MSAKAGRGSEAYVERDQATVILNDTEISSNDVMDALRTQHPEVAALVRWGTETQAIGRNGGIFQRDRYLTPDAVFDQFRTALDAIESDDVVSGVMETTESLAFHNIKIECDDEDETDVWNQILEDIDFYTRAREMWRELFSVSQYYAATYWVRKDYKVRGKTKDGNRKKKEFKGLVVPGGITMLDPLKVVPVGNFMFGKEQLAYIADRDQVQNFDNVLAGENTTDLVVAQLLSGRYEPDKSEKKYLKDITNKNVDNLFLLNPTNVWRHTATRPAYQRFATVRMKSVFEILDMKQQLRQMDRAHLIGGTNFIVLVKKGSDTQPAKQAEVQALATQVKMAARVPVIVGDHRIEVEIVTPKMDFTLIPEKYNTLDARITARLFQMFMTGNYSAGAKGDDSIKLARVVARGMETRRNMIGLNTLRNLILPTFRKNTMLTEVPELNFQPKRISLDFDPNVLAYFQELRDRGDLSRETVLGELDIDQEKEFRRRKLENELYDDTFKPPMAMLAPGAPGGPPAPPLPPVTPGTPAKKPAGNSNPSGKAGGGGKGPAAKTGSRKGGMNTKSPTSTPRKGGPNKSIFEELAELDPIALARLERSAKRALAAVPAEEEENYEPEEAQLIKEIAEEIVDLDHGIEEQED